MWDLVMPRHKQRINYAVYGKTGVVVKERPQKQTGGSGDRPPSQAKPDDSKLGATGGAEPIDPIDILNLDYPDMSLTDNEEGVEEELEMLDLQKKDATRRLNLKKRMSARDQLRKEVADLESQVRKKEKALGRRPGDDSNPVLEFLVEDEERGDPTLPAGLPTAPSEHSVASGELAFDELGLGGGDAPRGSQTKSGFVAKTTDSVRFPQIWPHVALQDELFGKHLGFLELNFRLFAAGELEIITRPGISTIEQTGRLGLLKQLAYLNGYHDWKVVRNVYMAIVRKIEVGVLSWQSSFIGEIQWMCTKLYAMGSMAGSSSNKQAGAVRAGRSEAKTKTEGFWWCRDFNREKGCSLGDPHVAQVYGKQVIVNHVCAKCWIEDKVKAQHAEESSACPKRVD